MRAMLNAVQISRLNFFLLRPPKSWRGEWQLRNGGIETDADWKVGGWVWIEPPEGQSLVERGSYRVSSALPAGGGYAFEGLEGVSDVFGTRIHAQNIPQSVVELAERMAAWEADNPPTNVISESVAGVHSYQLARSAVEQGGLPQGVLDVFDRELSAIPRQPWTGVRY